MKCPVCKKEVEFFEFKVTTLAEGVWSSKDNQFVLTATDESLERVICPHCTANVMGNKGFSVGYPEWDWKAE